MSASVPDSNPLPIIPITRPLDAFIPIPGSKSITNRALLLAALCNEEITLEGALFSDDTLFMAKALRAVGFSVVEEQAASRIHISGQNQAWKANAPVELFVGLAGTAARFLTALCAAAPRGVYRIDGVPKMRERPMKELIEALRSLGADILCEEKEGFLPIRIHACGLKGGTVTIDASASSQFLSALMMVAPLARSPLTIIPRGQLRTAFLKMTAHMMEQFSQSPIDIGTNAPLTISNKQPYKLASARYPIEADATAATYFMCLPLLAKGRLRLPFLPRPPEGLQGDTRFIEILQTLGLKISRPDNTLLIEAPQSLEECNLSRRFSPTHPFIDQNFNSFSDTFLTLAALSPLLGGITRISGIAHTRRQESDRVSGAANELRKLGQEVIEKEDSLEIHPRPLKCGVKIETYHDHRFAMSFAMLGCYDLQKNGKPWLSIINPGCSRKTFPEFFNLLNKLQCKVSSLSS